MIPRFESERKFHNNTFIAVPIILIWADSVGGSLARWTENPEAKVRLLLGPHNQIILICDGRVVALGGSLRQGVMV